MPRRGGVPQPSDTTTRSPSVRRASQAFSSSHDDVFHLGALVTTRCGHHHPLWEHACRARSGRERASPGGRLALPTPQQTHSGERPASECADPLAQDGPQCCRGLQCKIWSGAAIEGDRRHTSAGPTLPHRSVPLQGIAVMVHEHMATHSSSSSPCLSSRMAQWSHWRSCPILGTVSTLLCGPGTEAATQYADAACELMPKLDCFGGTTRAS